MTEVHARIKDNSSMSHGHSHAQVVMKSLFAFVPEDALGLCCHTSCICRDKFMSSFEATTVPQNAFAMSTADILHFR